MMLKNRLSDSTSPYLQQHANNPVAWQPWDDAALKAAKESDKPILVSIGYSACHWCHVMEHESFEDPQIAEIMNEAFVCIKVDREERPDVDQVYMEAVQALGINGGWPLNVFLTSEQKPFYGGTYFPKETWARVLKGISNAYRENREQIEEDSNKVTEHLSRQAFSTTEKIIESKDISGMAEALSQKFDHEWGGIDKAPKFPMPSIWMFLLKWSKISGEKQSLDFVHKTMLKMTNGGIFDLVRGGFARYSVDRFWKVPHFEKMLYDNGQLLSLLAVTVKETQDLQLRSALKKTCEWIRDEMTDKDGGFYSAYDADSEGEEGKYYIWSIDEIETILEDDAPLFKEYFDISFEGNWEHGNNILFSRVNSEAFAKSKNISHASFLLYLDSCYSKLKAHQEKRIPPGLDHKKIASWNALCIMGLLDAYYILEEGWILDLALNNAEYLKRVHLEGSKLFRIVDESQKIQGFHDDYAAVSSAFISVYEYTLDESWLDYADKLAHYVIENFAEEGQSHFFYTDKTGSQLVARKKELFDNVIPASNSIMAHALHRLGALKTDTQLMHRAKQMTEGMAEVMISNPDYLTHWASMAINIVTPTIEIAVTGPDYLMNAFRINREFNVNTVTAGSGDDSNLLLLQNRISDSNSIFVCENGVCHLPSKDTEAALAQINSIRNI